MREKEICWRCGRELPVAIVSPCPECDPGKIAAREAKPDLAGALERRAVRSARSTRTGDSAPARVG